MSLLEGSVWAGSIERRAVCSRAVWARAARAGGQGPGRGRDLIGTARQGQDAGQFGRRRGRLEVRSRGQGQGQAVGAALDRLLGGVIGLFGSFVLLAVVPAWGLVVLLLVRPLVVRWCSRCWCS